MWQEIEVFNADFQCTYGAESLIWKLLDPSFFMVILMVIDICKFCKQLFKNTYAIFHYPFFQTLNIFQQDGAPAHNTRAVVNFLNNRFSNCWIGTNGLVRWPPRSPGLTPCDFFLWRYIKDTVYATVPENEEELCHKISTAIEDITTEML